MGRSSQGGSRTIASTPLSHITMMPNTAHNPGAEVASPKSKTAPSWRAPLTPVVEATRERFQNAFAAAPRDAGPAYRSWLAARHGARDALSGTQCDTTTRQEGLSTSQRRLRQTFQTQGGEKL